MSFAGKRSCRIRRGHPWRSGARISRSTWVWFSCSAVPLQPAALELLVALAPILARWGRWYVFGAQAVTLYGVPRLSADVDITLALAPDDPESFSREMGTSGFALRVDDADFVRRTRVMPFVHVATGMPLDVVLASSGLEDDFLDRAKVVDLGGTTARVIDLADLIIAKILASRPKDLEDVASLWRLHLNVLDAGRIRRTLQLLEEALGQSDLLPAFDAIADRSEGKH